MTLNYQMSGSGQPLVVVHGLFGSADNWRGIAKLLQGERKVISLDLRNHGHSFHHPQQTYPIMAADIAALMDDLGLEHVDLLGHSIGGKVAMQFAQDFASRLRKLIVVDMAPRVYSDEHSQILKALMGLNLSSFQQRAEIDAALAHTISNKSVRQFLLMNLQKTEAGFNWRINLDALLCNYPVMLQSVVPSEPVHHRCCFITGANSDYVTKKDKQQISMAFPRSELVTLPDAGHWVHADQPQRFAETVKGFLNDD